MHDIFLRFITNLVALFWTFSISNTRPTTLFLNSISSCPERSPYSRGGKPVCRSAGVYRRWREVTLAKRQAGEYCQTPLRIFVFPRESTSMLACCKVEWTAELTHAAVDRLCWLRSPDTVSAVCCWRWRWTSRSVTLRRRVVCTTCSPAVELAWVHRTDWALWPVTLPEVELTSLRLTTVWTSPTVTSDPSAVGRPSTHRLVTLAGLTCHRRHTDEMFARSRRGHSTGSLTSWAMMSTSRCKMCCGAEPSQPTDWCAPTAESVPPSKNSAPSLFPAFPSLFSLLVLFSGPVSFIFSPPPLYAFFSLSLPVFFSFSLLEGVGCLGEHDMLDSAPGIPSAARRCLDVLAFVMPYICHLLQLQYAQSLH